jgi:hypothetical protein
VINGRTGDLNGDGLLDVTDARWVAEAAIGIRELSPEERERADVAPPFGVIDITDARFLAEAALGLRAISSLDDAQPTGEPLVINRILVSLQGKSLSFRVAGQGVESLRVEVYDLAGNAVFSSGWAHGSALRWNLLDASGRPVANGAYLYVVTVRDASGALVKSEVRKLALLR